MHRDPGETIARAIGSKFYHWGRLQPVIPRQATARQLGTVAIPAIPEGAANLASNGGPHGARAPPRRSTRQGPTGDKPVAD